MTNDQIAAKLDGLGETLRSEFARVDARFNEVEARFNEVDTRLTALERHTVTKSRKDRSLGDSV